MTDNAPPPAGVSPAPHCDACRFAVAPTRASSGPIIGCAMHNVLRLRLGQGCGDHDLPEDPLFAMAQTVARANRIRLVVEASRHA